MMIGVVHSTMVPVDGAEIFTVVALPDETGTFPTVLFRSPYVDAQAQMTVAEIEAQTLEQAQNWLAAGYAVVHQHCRGRGHSTGECIPGEHERADGLALQEWVRRQPFYQQELYLVGGSYTALVHFVTAPFAPDIKGAILEIMSAERFDLLYLNGFYMMGMHGGWFVDMYKKKQIRQKNYTSDAFRTLPLTDFAPTVFGEEVPVFTEMLRHPEESDPFWQTDALAGNGIFEAMRHVNIPILLVTHYCDICPNGVYRLFEAMDAATKAQSALLVSPYAHAGVPDNQALEFPNAAKNTAFAGYQTQWLDAIRGKGAFPFTPGKVTYYRSFENEWRTDDFAEAPTKMRIPLGTESFTYVYNPYNPAPFKGGLANSFDGAKFQDAPNSRYDIRTVYTEPFAEDTMVQGSIRAVLRCASDCEDTCFYVRISLAHPAGDFGLVHDIRQISEFDKAYQPNTARDISFECLKYPFLIRKGQRLRVDISSSCWPYFVPHTNQRGLFSTQTTAKIAHNTVRLKESYLELPIETGYSVEGHPNVGLEKAVVPKA